MIDSQNRTGQRAAVGRSELAAQNNSGFRGMFPVFSENIPIRGDTGCLDKEKDQRDSHVAQRDADFEEVLEEIDAEIVEVGDIIHGSSNVKSQKALCGTSLIDVAVQDAGGTPNLNAENILQVLRVGLDVDSFRLGFKIGCDSADVIKSKRTYRISCKGKRVVSQLLRVLT